MNIDCTRSSAEILNDVRVRTLERETQFRQNLLVLYAGCNIPLNASLPYAPSLDAMPAMGPPNCKEQPGSKLVAELEVAMATVAASLFRAPWADARLPSCTMANLVLYHAFGGGGLMLAPALSDGGHFSQVGGGTPSIARLSTIDLAFNSTTQMLDSEASARQIESIRPALVMLGRSVILHPDKLDNIVCSAKRVGARTIYDASHVAGLIAGGVFPNPLDVGVDFITMSTYKTLGGPPGAIIAGSGLDDAAIIQRVIDGAFLANQGAARYPSLLASLLALRDSTDEPKLIVANAETFKSALVEHGIEVLAPNCLAATHQVVVPIGSLDAAIDAMKRLEAAGILVGRCPIPGYPNHYGLRFGVQYATRLHLDGHAMREAAYLIARLLRSQSSDARMLSDTAIKVVEILKSASPSEVTSL